MVKQVGEIGICEYAKDKLIFFLISIIVFSFQYSYN
jgi:hypothetical protein